MDESTTELLVAVAHDLFLTCLMDCIKNPNNTGRINDLKNIFNNPNNIKLLLMYYGLSENVLSCPAHRLALEEIAQTCLDTIIDSDFAIIDVTRLKQKDDRVIRIEIGSRRFLSDKLELRFKNDGYYSFLKYSYRNSLLDYEDLLISGTAGRIYSKMKFDNNTTKQSIIGLNKYGFAVRELSEEDSNKEKKTTALKLCNSTIQIGESTNNGVNWDSDQDVKWSGNPLHLNSENCTGDDRTKNIMLTIKRNPNSIQFYKNIFGEKDPVKP